MEARKNTNVQKSLKLDFYFLERCLKKNLYVILLLGILAGVATFVGIDFLAGSTFSAKVHLAVITRGGSSLSYDVYHGDMALRQNISALNSESLKNQMKKKMPEMQGSLKADSVEETNIITMTATASSAYEAISILKTAVETYPELSGYFGTGYILKQIEPIGAGRITKSRRNPVKYGLAMMVFVWMAGCGLVGMYVLLSDSIHSLSQSANELDVKMLGKLHFVKKKRNQKAVLINDGNLSIAYLEEMDLLAANVQRQMDQNGFKKLMVSSIYENEGKSTVAINVALSLSKRGKKVVLVDLDLRRPAVAKIFDYEISGKKGMSDFLMGNASGGEILTRSLDQPNFFRIFQGKPASNVERLISDEKLPELLEILSGVADYVIIDTPPAGVVQDAEILAAMIDATLLVIRQDMVGASEINDVTEVLEEVGTTVIGGVLNMVKDERNSIIKVGSYEQYYSNYGYKNTAH